MRHARAHPLWNGEAEAPTGPGFSREEIAYFQVDHLGTPQELTDHEGSIAWAAQYKAWGQAREVISEAARKAGVSNPIRFQGQYWDEETELHHNRHRYYDPASGRFASKDPIGFFGELNTDSYVGNPVQFADLLGLAPPCNCAKKIKEIESQIALFDGDRAKYDPIKDAQGEFKMRGGS